jgi:Domain of unknown function (DUF5615)
VRWLADENFPGPVLRGVIRREPTIDIVRAQDVGLLGQSDPEVLEWAVQNGRVVLTRDYSTLLAAAYDRIRLGLPSTGVFAMRPESAIGALVEEILTLEQCSAATEWENQVVFLPLYR